MKYFLALVLSLLSLNAAAQSGWFYDSELDGEGFVVLTTPGNFAFTFYTYDYPYERITPPTVSPAPPETAVTVETGPVWVLGTGLLSNDTGDSWAGDLNIYVADTDDTLSRAVRVGTFSAEYEGEGWVFSFQHVENPYFGANSPLYFSGYETVLLARGD